MDSMPFIVIMFCATLGKAWEGGHIVEPPFTFRTGFIALGSCPLVHSALFYRNRAGSGLRRRA